MSNEKNNEGLNLSKKYASVLVKPTETIIATYGNDYFQNIIVSGNYERFSFILTDKRLYYKGTRFEEAKGKSNSAGIGISLIEECLDLKDITKSGFEHFTSIAVFYFFLGGGSIIWGFCAWGWLRIMFIVLAIVLILCGYIVKTLHTFTAIKFDYAGGSFCGNIKLYGEASARDFLKQVKRAQDEYKQ